MSGRHVDVACCVDDAAYALGVAITMQLFRLYANGKLRPVQHGCQTLTAIAARVGRETSYYDMVEDHHGGW